MEPKRFLPRPSPARAVSAGELSGPLNKIIAGTSGIYLDLSLKSWAKRTLGTRVLGGEQPDA